MLFTDEQLKQLADELQGTTGNIYRVVERLFNQKADDSVFDALKERCGLQRCVECNVWLSTSEFDGCDGCIECMGAIDGDE